jgi:conjugal transfer pilus assembly protein TraV
MSHLSRLILCVPPLLLLLGGCATSGKTDFECPATAGGACMSANAIYQATNNADAVNAQQPTQDGDQETDHQSAGPERVVEVVGGPVPTPTIRDPTPIREPAKVMRIWIAPWEDLRGNLMVSNYVYTEVENRRWSIGGTAMDNSTTALHPLQVEQRKRPVRTRQRINEEPFIEK